MIAIEAHEKIQNKATKTLKKDIVIKSMKIGEFVRQGDVYITRIECITGSKKIFNPQLAPGTTKGSRHTVEVGGGVNLFKGYVGKDIPDAVKGPQVQSDKEFKVSHPEHVDCILPAGDYQVTYQLDWSRQERVRD